MARPSWSGSGHKLCLAGLLLSALALRFWGIGFGLPNVNCRPDESILVHKALSIASGDPNPHFFNYPSFQFYLLALLYGLYFAGGWVVGAFAGVAQFELEFYTDPSAFYTIGRSASALLGVASVAIVYRLGRGMGGIRCGLLSAAFLTTCFLHVRDSHFLTVDVPATCYALLAFAWIWRFIEVRQVSAFYVAAGFIGLAASTKYNAVLLMPALLFSAFAMGERGSRQPDDGDMVKWKLVVIGCVIAIAAFAAVTPYALLDSSTFLRDFLYEREHFERGHGVDLGRGWTYHLPVTLAGGMGWPLLIVAIAGCVWLAYRRSPKDLVLLTGVGLYYAVAGSGRSVFFRYMVPIVPLLCLAAGSWLAHISASWRASRITFIAVALMLPGLYASVQHNRILAATDTRVQAADWIRNHVPTGESIAMVGSAYGYPQLFPSRRWLEERYRDVRAAGLAGRRLARKLEIEGFPPEPGGYYRVELRPTNPYQLRSVWTTYTLDSLRDRGIRWIVIQQHPLAVSSVDVDFLRSLESAGIVRARFEPYADRVDVRPLFDPIDAYFVPYSGFEGVARGGPALSVFQLFN